MRPQGNNGLHQTNRRGSTVAESDMPAHISTKLKPVDVPDWRNLKVHEIAKDSPGLDSDKFDRVYKHLGASIKARGLLEAIILYEGKILDGRHRHAACIRHDVAPRFIEFTGTPEEALDLVIGRNLLRRHLSVSQRAIWAAKLVNTRQGERIDLLATKVGVSEESVRRARKILESAKRSDGGKAILSFVLRGEVTVKAGAKVIDGDRADETVSDDRTGDVDKIKDLASFKKV